MNIDDAKIIKELGHGMFGTVYLCSYHGKQYALKIGKIIEKDIDDRNSHINIEIDVIIKMFAFDFVDNCKHKQKYSMDLNFFKERYPAIYRNFIKISESDWCCRQIFELVDFPLSKILNNLTPQQCYSGLIQLLFCVHIMRKLKIAHNDLHSKNIGVVKTHKKYVIVLERKVPTFGYIFKPIDFGLACMNKTKPKCFIKGTNNDFNMYSIFAARYPFWDKYIEGHRLEIDFKKANVVIRRTSEYKTLDNLVNDPNDKMFLFELVYPDKHQQILLGKHFKKTLPPELRIPITDVIYICNHKDNIRELLNHLISRLVS